MDFINTALKNLFFVFLFTLVSAAFGQIKVAYVVSKEPLIESAAGPGEDKIVRTLEQDPNIEITRFIIDSDPKTDFAGFDVVIAQSPLHSSDPIWKSGGSLDFGSINVPMIYNSMWSFMDGRGVSSGGGQVHETYDLIMEILPEHLDHEIFKGLRLGGNKFKLFYHSKDSDADFGGKSINYTTGVEIGASGIQLATTNQVSPESDILILNEIPPGTMIGDRTTKSRMLVLGLDMGPISANNGENVTNSCLTLFRNAVYYLSGEQVPSVPIRKENTLDITGLSAYWSFGEYVGETVFEEYGGSNGTLDKPSHIPLIDLMGNNYLRWPGMIVDQSDSLVFDKEADFTFSFRINTLIGETPRKRSAFIHRTESPVNTHWAAVNLDGDELIFTLRDGSIESALPIKVKKIWPSETDLDSWVHICVVRNTVTDMQEIYLNGELAASAQDITIGDISFRESFLHIIKMYSASDGQNMYIDDFQVYNRALSTEEIKQLSDHFDPDPLSAKYGADASLSSLHFDGSKIAGFESDKMDYRIELPPSSDTSDIKTIIPFLKDRKAKFEITYPPSLPGKIVIDVEAEDEFHKSQYSIYVYSPNENERFDVLLVGDTESREDRMIQRALQSWGYSARLINSEELDKESYDNYSLFYVCPDADPRTAFAFKKAGFFLPSIIANVESLSSEGLGFVNEEDIVHTFNLENILITKETHAITDSLYDADTLVRMHVAGAHGWGREVKQYGFIPTEEIDYVSLGGILNVTFDIPFPTIPNWALINDFPGNENKVKMIAMGFEQGAAFTGTEAYWNHLKVSVEFLIGEPKATTQICNPAFADIYDFEVGDVFQTEEMFASWAGTKTISKFEVTSKLVSGDTIKYHVSGIKKTEYDCRDEENPCLLETPKHSSRTFEEDLIYVDSAGHYLNLCDGELFRNYQFGVVEDSYLQMNSSDTLKQFGLKVFTYDDRFELQVHGIDFEKQFAPGLGKIRERHFDFDYGYQFELVGYVKDGDTVGIVLEDNILLNTKEPIKGDIYPNPSSGVVYFDHLSLKEIRNIEVFDLIGNSVFLSDSQIHSLDLSHLNKGMYILKVQSGDQTFSQRLMLK